MAHKPISLATPFLLVEQTVLARNHLRLIESLDALGTEVRLRPHVKAHKCGTLARFQVDNGCVGVCAATVSEALLAAKAGAEDILVANELASAASVANLLRVAAAFPNAKLRVCVDSFPLVRLLSDACARNHAIGVLVEVNAGQDRCGSHPDNVVAIARAVIQAGLAFDGIQCYQGMLQHVRDAAERRDRVNNSAVAIARVCRDRLLAAGIPCPIISGGGTGTFTTEASSGVFTEIQAGSYLFMDADYSKNEPEPGVRFECSLFVVATVISVDPQRRWAVLDAGLKAVSLDSGPPVVVGYENTLTYKSGGDEHGIVSCATDPEPSPLPDTIVVGMQVRLIPGHCDPTINLYQELVVVKDGIMSEIWDIGAHYSARI
ncbi:hypothetical protein BC830DRAFT_1135570 [Chytriomyces sp. MP71]|nr:hypothetical protein BC830DRAFT_1135570 [Chytriomyces sp. MP71]